ncbi:bifunctional TVP38/TMEM64 family protein/FAD-dependent oxidoreductase [Motilimonas sp. E26]|uniref:FAD-dependent oxidoreductase n=1 Tax=Motilimonas sp. E26 TaxID=2865674 RepID=UPI001E5FFD32|nr:bifunctional TVP38/TMEM64 family protein/FAD-dependent oxidoreductase [Motilimonas sp. E26]MCE0556167.1 FAD-dependent oxidoreductase [Motilimonas sp. E26]
MKINKWLLLVAILVLAALFFALGLNQYLTLDYIQQQHLALQQAVEQQHLLYALGFFAAYVLITAGSLPGAAVLTLLAGALFGLVEGFIIVSFASSIGATLAFLVARYLLRERLQAKWGHKLTQFNQGVEKQGAQYLLSLRLLPVVPFFLINLLMGLTSIKTRTFYWVSQLGMIPGTLVYVNAGTELSKISSLQDIASPSLWFAFALLAILPHLIRWSINRYQQYNRYKPYPKPKKFDYNLVVIGAGAGGLVSSYIAATVNAKVAIIEKHKMGGDCLNTGCVPSKALLRSAHFAAELNKAASLGFEPITSKVDFKAVMDRVHDVIKQVEPHDSIERYSKLGVNCLQGKATIKTPYAVELNGQTLLTENIIIATGAKPFVPPIKGLDQIEYLTSDSLWQLEQLPPRLLVVGAGPIGCELAQAFARLGSRVTLIDIAKQLLPREDPSVSSILLEQFQLEGIQCLLNTSLNHFSRDTDGQWAHYQTSQEEQRFSFDKVLIAVGRKANTEGLGLEPLGINLETNGTITLDPYLRTQYPNIFAVGDVAGPMQFTHFAAHQAWYASVNALFGHFKKFKADYRVIPSVTYCDPPIAQVGINETRAKAENIPYELTEFAVDELDRAIADSAKTGVVRVLTIPNKDTILGVTIVGQHAGETIGEFVLAMKHGLGLNKILGTVHAYPTMLEANKYAAGVWKQKHKPTRILALLGRYFRSRRG